MNMPPAIRVFGTVVLSTTVIHGVHGIDPKYSAAAFDSASVMFFAMAIMMFVSPESRSEKSKLRSRDGGQIDATPNGLTHVSTRAARGREKGASTGTA